MLTQHLGDLSDFGKLSLSGKVPVSGKLGMQADRMIQELTALGAINERI